MIRAISPTGEAVELNASEKAFRVIFAPKGYRLAGGAAIEQTAAMTTPEVVESPLAALTKGELAEKAESLGIEVPANLRTINKDELIAQIEQAEAQGSETEESAQVAD